MDRIPIGIREIKETGVVGREVIARFDYRFPGLVSSESVKQIVLFDEPYQLSVIVGKEYEEWQISNWVKAHDGRWSAADFLKNKIIENGGSLAPKV